MLSFDDYHPNNDWLAEACNGLEAIFFIDFRDKKAKKQIKKLSRNFEIGAHTINHALLTRIPWEEAKWEIEDSKRRVEDITGKLCRWFAYPRGYYNDDVLNLVENAGFQYARTVKLIDGKSRFEKGGIHLTYPREEYKGVNPFAIARLSRTKHYWGHMFEIEKWGWQEEFKSFIKWYKKNVINQ